MKQVLVIESESAHEKQVREQLEAVGYQPVECDAVQTTIEHLRSGAPAVVFSGSVAALDTEFCRELAKLERRPTVVVVSDDIRRSLDSETLETLRDGGFYFMPTEGEHSMLEYRLPREGINFSDLERDLLSQALRICKGNQTRAAALLGLSRDQVRHRLAKFHMTGSRLNGTSDPLERTRSTASTIESA